ncbi:MAG: hypothetical protein HY556_06185 [Euryarchaeota archaeon]|nr:hypothetical protein [Euryarchaeota archaeon]
MRTQEELAPHVREIIRALEDKPQETEIATELERFMEFGIPLQQAKREIIRNHGGGAYGVRRTLDSLTGPENSVHLLVKILTVNPKEVTVAGEKRAIFYGLLGDETRVLPYTAWRDFQLEKGAVVKVLNAYATVWQEAPQINLGDRTTIAPSDETITPPERVRPPTERKVEQLESGLNNVSIIGRVMGLFQKTVESKEGTKGITSGVLVDETGRVPFTVWGAVQFKDNDVIRVRGAYVKSWRGAPNLNVNDGSGIEVLEQIVLPGIDVLAKEPTRSIGEIARVGGATGVAVEGTLLEIKQGSGLVFRCGQCNRVLQKRECRVHGKVDGVPDLRVKGVLDDGTGVLTAFIGRPLTEKLIGRTLDECQQMARDAMSPDVIQTEMIAKLAAKPLRVTGNVTSDEFGLMLIATGAEPLSIVSASLADEARSILSRLEVA